MLTSKMVKEAALAAGADICDNCGECVKACPGNAIREEKGVLNKKFKDKLRKREEWALDVK